MKKILLSTLFVFLVGCNNHIYDLSINLNENTSLYSQSLKLPSLPNRAIFATFNNAYKGLYEENMEIAKKDPNNSDKYFFKIISSAKKTLDVAIFDIENEDAVSYIINAKKRGVKVRVVTDSDNLKDEQNPNLPRKVIEDMKQEGIEVVDDKRNAFMHHKFMIIDSQYVWLGSMNATTRSMYHHNNNSLLIRSSELAENYNVVFNKLFNNKDFSTPLTNIPYPVIELDGSIIRTYFSPNGNTKKAIMERLNKAKKSIRFMAFAFTDKDIADILIKKKNEGLIVEGIYDSCLIGKYSTYYTLRENKILALRDGNQALMHSKTFIIDNKTVITGSFNFSKSAEESNNEDTLIIDSYGLATVYTGEYFRLRNSAFNNKNLPPYDHPACGGGNNNSPTDNNPDLEG
jgi:phosphatidylserine/phosphatidylglycerophosphate/cardiolipin synthase-like enzyme